MKLLDANVFIYARGRSHPYKASCEAILAEAGSDPDAYGVDVEMLQELLEVYARRRERAFGVRLVEETLVGFPYPFPITRDEIERASAIVKRHRKLSPRDALHAAVVMNHRLEGIVSPDRAFERVAGVRLFDPVDLAPA